MNNTMNHFEVLPVVDGDGCITPFDTLAEAHEYAREVDGGVFWGLYIRHADGLAEHILDRVYLDGMTDIIKTLTGVEVDLSGGNKVKFSASTTGTGGAVTPRLIEAAETALRHH